LQYLREQGSTVDTTITIATAEGVVLSVYANLLACNGGVINLTKPWSRCLLSHKGMVREELAVRLK